MNSIQENIGNHISKMWLEATSHDVQIWIQKKTSSILTIFFSLIEHALTTWQKQLGRVWKLDTATLAHQHFSNWNPADPDLKIH